jgi:hypothetical protein
MNCPNCSQEIQENSESCPFCQADVNVEVLDLEDDTAGAGGLDDAMAALEEGIDKEPAPPPVPAPGAQPSEPAAEPIIEQQSISDVAAPESSQAPPSRKQPPALVIGLLVFAGAYQFGLLDTVLYTIGLKTPPEAESSIVVKKEPEEEPEEEVEPDVIEEPEVDLAPEPAPQPVVEVKEEPKPEPEPKVEEVVLPEEWWFYGKVYDLLTLQRIAGVEMTFIGEDDFNVTTNAKGEFKIRLPIPDGGGYDLLIDREGYTEGYLLDRKPSYQSLSSSKRNHLWGANPKKPKPWRGSQGKWKRRDLVLFPSLSGN